MASDGVIIPALANGEVTRLVQGEIVRQSTLAKNTALRALATSAAGVQGTLGIVLSGSVGPDGPVITEISGHQPVLLEGGLAPVIGQWVFVSATVAGRGTNVQPTIAVPVGTILDTSTYARDSRVLVSMPVVLTPASATQTGLMSAADAAKLATGGAFLGEYLISDEIDFTAVQIVIFRAPVAKKLAYNPTFAWLVTVKDGTVTTGPTVNSGTNAAINDLYTSTVQSNLAAAALNGRVALQGAVGTGANMDLTANGIRVQITAGAVLGTATQFKGRIITLGPAPVVAY